MTNEIRIASLTMALCLGAAGAAFGQTAGTPMTGASPSGMSAPGMSTPGGSANAGMTPAAATPAPKTGTSTNTDGQHAAMANPATPNNTVALDIQGRKGPEQRQLELVETSLLNRFGDLGFVGMRDFRKVGNTYTAEIETGDDVWKSVDIDPRTRQITEHQEASGPNATLR